MAKPSIPCPNCQGTSWAREEPPQGTLSVSNVGSGQADRLDNKGLVYDVWKCNGCQYCMFFVRTP